MDTPFYRMHRGYPSRSPYFYNSPSSSNQIPVQHKTTPVNVPKKVVSIPVRDAGSEQARSGSAIKIQKVFRGFLVRKSVKKILAIRREVAEIEKRISMEESVELMRRNQKEKVKTNEMLMSLLFKLDSVRGVDSGVRDCRKAVIKKAIALQEIVDSITAAPASDGDNVGYVNGVEGVNDSAKPAGEKEEEDKKCEVNNSVENAVDESQNHVQAEADSDSMPVDLKKDEDELQNHGEVDSMPLDSRKDEEGVDKTRGPLQGEMETSDMELTEVVGDEDMGNQVDCEAERVLEVVNEELREAEGADMACEEEEQGDDDDKDGDVAVSTSDRIGSLGASQEESQSGTSGNPPSLNGGDGEEDSGGNGQEQDVLEKQQDDDGGVKSKDGEEKVSRRRKELLERMMEDNERMMGMMAELYVRNEMQTRLLSSLSQRVEHLERAYVCEKLRRKKKRNAAAGLVDCLESTQDTNKKGGKKL